MLFVFKQRAFSLKEIMNTQTGKSIKRNIPSMGNEEDTNMQQYVKNK